MTKKTSSKTQEAVDATTPKSELAMCELLAVDYYARIKALYCSDRFSRDEAGWQALIDQAWADAMANHTARKRRVEAAVSELSLLEDAEPDGASFH